MQSSTDYRSLTALTENADIPVRTLAASAVLQAKELDGTTHFDDSLPMFFSLPEEASWQQPSSTRPRRKTAWEYGTVPMAARLGSDLPAVVSRDRHEETGIGKGIGGKGMGTDGD